MGLTVEMRAELSALQTGSNDFGGPRFNPSVEKVIRLTDGTGANQADILWADSRTLAASASEDLDLAGVLTDAFGATVAAAELVGILVAASSDNTHDVVIGAATAPVPLFGGTNGTFAVKPGGFFFVAAPGAAGQATIGAGSTDDLKIANGGAVSAVSYDIVVVARSA